MFMFILFLAVDLLTVLRLYIFLLQYFDCLLILTEMVLGNTFLLAAESLRGRLPRKLATMLLGYAPLVHGNLLLTVVTVKPLSFFEQIPWILQVGARALPPGQAAGQGVTEAIHLCMCFITFI